MTELERKFKELKIQLKDFMEEQVSFRVRVNKFKKAWEEQYQKFDKRITYISDDIENHAITLYDLAKKIKALEIKVNYIPKLINRILKLEEREEDNDK